jgi:uncharacterized protein (TIGR03435 family)
MIRAISVVSPSRGGSFGKAVSSGKLSAKLLFVAVTLVGATTLVSVSYAQVALPTFEVATIKPSNPNNTQHGTGHFSQGKFDARNITLKELIATAYDLGFDTSQQISGGPGWVKFEKFDVVAKVDETILAQLGTLSPERQGEQLRMMIQQLLSDRFALRIHREPKELTVYTLVIAKGGPKLKPGQLQPNLRGSLPQTRIDTRGPGFLVGHNAPATLLARVLSGQPEIGGRSVLDKTGLSGKYDFTLKWMPESTIDGPSTQEDLATLFTALQEQLGLQLRSKKATVDVITIDSVSPPSDN